MTIQIRRTATPNNPPVDLAPGQLSVEMASTPPRLWCGVPTEIDPSGRVEVAIAGEDAGDYSTGDAILTLQTEADPGWILMDDGTIGDAGSGATHAGPEFGSLFGFLYDILDDEAAPLYDSAGVNISRDLIGAGSAWETGYRMQLPLVLGRAPITAGQGAGLTNRPLGRVAGEDSHPQTNAELPQHSHPVSDPTHSHTGVAQATAQNNGYHWFPSWSTELTFFNWWSYTNGEVNVAYGGVGISIQNNGSGQGLNVTQPSAAWNIMLKL